VQFIGARDPAPADVLTYAFDFNNDGVLDTAFGASSSVVVPVQYLRQSGTLVVRGVVKDDDGGSAEGTTTIVVKDVPPTLTVSGAATTTEGSVYQLALSATDPGNDVISRWVVDWGDGNIVGYAAAGNITVQYTYGDNRTPANTPTVIKVSAIDNDGTYQAADKAITVANAAPVLSNLAIVPILENGVARLSGTIADAGKLDTFTISVDWQDGSAVEDFSFAARTSAFDVTHRYLQDGSYKVGVALTDKDGGRDQGSLQLTVTNVAPVMTAFAVTGGTTSIEESRAISVTGAYTDVGSLDTHAVVINWGDGTTSSSTRGRADFDPTLIVNTINRTFTASHAYADDNPTGTPSDLYTISATVTDEKGASDSGTASITVVNVPPKVSTLAFNGVAAMTAPEKGPPAAPTITVDENGVLTVTGTFTDLSRADTHTVTIEWGEGTPTKAIVTVDAVDPRVRHYTASHQYLDDNPTGTPADNYEVKIRIEDDDGGVTTTRATVTIANVPPVVATIDLDRLSVDENGIVSISGTITDIGTLDTHVVRIAWGDGKSELVAVDPASRTYAASHRYLDDDPTGTPSDIATITVTAIDDDSGEGSKTAQVTLINLPPVIESMSLDRHAIVEGDAVVLSGHVTDVGTLDTHTVTIVWGDGKSEVVTVDPATRNFSVRHVYVDDDPSGTPVDTYKITAIATDDDTGASAAVEESVQVSNSPPSITMFVENAKLIEGDVVVLVIHVTDVGALDTHAVTIVWGDGKSEVVNLDAATRDFSVRHVYVDDNPSGTPVDTYKITAIATDDDTGVSAAVEEIVQVSNSAPRITTLTTNADLILHHPWEAFTVSGTIEDLGVADVLTIRLDWADGHTSTIVLQPSADGSTTRTFTASHNYLRAGAYTVKVSVLDDDNGAASTTTLVSVPLMLNVQPADTTPVSIGALVGLAVNAGPTFDLGLTPMGIGGLTTLGGSGRPAGASDPSTTGSISNENGGAGRISVDEGGELRLPKTILDTLAPNLAELTLDWGDGSSETIDPASLSSRVPHHVYADDSGDGTFRLTLRTTDEHGESKTASYDVTVRNVAPTFEQVGWDVVAGADENRLLVTGKLSDPGLNDVHIVSVTWSDGAVTQETVVNGPDGRVFSMSRAAADGLRPVTVVATDAKDAKSVASIRLNGTRADRPAPPVVPDPQRRGDAPQKGSKFASMGDVDGWTLAFGAGILGVGIAGARGRVTPINSGPLMQARSKPDERPELQQGGRVCLDAVLAARLAQFERRTAARPANARLIVPDDWGLGGDHVADVAALARAVGDAEDWQVLDRGRVVPFAAAAE
jgi:hypothetical protein